MLRRRQARASFSWRACKTRAIWLAGVLNNLTNLAGGSVQNSQELAAKNFNRRQIGQSQDRGLLEPLVIEIAKMDLQLVELGAKFLNNLGRRRDVTLSGNNRQLAGERAIEIGHPRFLGRQAEDRVLDDMNFGAGLGQAFAEFG